MAATRTSLYFPETILCLILVLSFASCQVFTPTQETAVNELVSSVMACYDVPGLTLGVVKGDQIWKKGYGFRDVENKSPVTTSTLFGIGSITKAFTAALLSILIDESNGKYKWTSKLTEVLGDDFKFDDNLRTSETTLRDILSHRTGLPSGDVAIYKGYSDNFTRTDMAKLLRYLEGSKPFRDGFMYNNWMYALAGYVVEKISGKTWQQNLEDHILKPIEMMETKIIGRNVQVTDNTMAKPYVLTGNQLLPSAPEIYDINPEQPAGAIASSADDMVKWIRVILNKGNTTDGQVIVDWKHWSEAFHPFTTVPGNLMTKPTFPINLVMQGYGYGWFIGNHDGYSKYWHSGGLFGYTAMLWIFPDLDIGFYSNINGPGLLTGSDAVHSTIMSYMFDLIMNNEPWLNQTTACSFPLPWKQPPPVKNNTGDITNDPVQNPQNYVGQYGHRMFGEIQITADGAALFVDMGRVQGFLNTTKTENLFKMQIVGDMAFLTHQKDVYTLIPVMFKNKKTDKFQDIELVLSSDQKYMFGRGIKWQDSDSNTNSSGKTKLFFENIFVTILILFLATYILN